MPLTDTAQFVRQSGFHGCLLGRDLHFFLSDRQTQSKKAIFTLIYVTPN